MPRVNGKARLPLSDDQLKVIITALPDDVEFRWITLLGASHQTGWTATIPLLAHLFARITPEQLLAAEPVLQRFRDAERIEAPGVLHR